MSSLLEELNQSILMLTIFHRLQHKDVFELIKKHNLYDVIYKSIVPLIQLDSEQAIAMLLERNKIPADVVVSQLQNHEEYLYLVGFFFIVRNSVFKSGKNG